jgi:divinyl protochlorophyllide a 8-vinyl-reductase
MQLRPAAPETAWRRRMGTVTTLAEARAIKGLPGHRPDNRVGPNAVIQLVAAIKAQNLTRQLLPAFASQDAVHWLSSPPSQLLDAERVGRLFRAVRASLSGPRAAVLMDDAGTRTADYLLANRIPRLARWLLRLLPPRLSARLLASAIRGNAWTFGAEGHFTVSGVSPLVFEIAFNPLCGGERSARPICAWHEAVFRRLFRALVAPRTEVVETECVAAGDPTCRFVVDWQGVEIRTTEPRAA